MSKKDIKKGLEDIASLVRTEWFGAGLDKQIAEADGDREWAKMCALYVDGLESILASIIALYKRIEDKAE